MYHIAKFAVLQLTSVYMKDNLVIERKVYISARKTEAPVPKKKT